jgi:hypothetical protein
MIDTYIFCKSYDYVGKIEIIFIYLKDDKYQTIIAICYENSLVFM